MVKVFKRFWFVCASETHTYICVFLCVCLRMCVCCRGFFVVLCRRVFPVCGGSDRRYGYMLMEHTRLFFFSCTSAHTHPTMSPYPPLPPLPPPPPPYRRSLLYTETSQLIHSAEGLSVIKICRSWFYSRVTDRHSWKFGSGLRGWSERRRIGSTAHSVETGLKSL